jgi:hypothetical protein
MEMGRRVTHRRRRQRGVAGDVRTKTYGYGCRLGVSSMPVTRAEGLGCRDGSPELEVGGGSRRMGLRGGIRQVGWRQR